MKRGLRQSYRISAACVREQRRLAWCSAALSLALLGGLLLGAALWTLPRLFSLGHVGSFSAVPFEEGEDASATDLPEAPRPPESPEPTLADMPEPPTELLPLELPEPVEFAMEELPELDGESPLQFPEAASLAFQPPAPTPRPAAKVKPAPKPAAAAPRPAAAPRANAGQSGGKLVAASYRSAPKPPYPPALRSSRIQGRVGVRITIDAEGRPTRVDITSPSAHADFDRTARSWILANWRFNPATRDGEPIPSVVNTRVDFVIS